MKSKLFVCPLCITCKITNLICRTRRSCFWDHVRNTMEKLLRHSSRGSKGVSYEPQWGNKRRCRRWSVHKHGCLVFGSKARPGGSCQHEASQARLSLPLSERAGQWRWGRWRGHGRGRCRGLRGQGLRERRHRNASADSETKSSPGRQPLGTPLDGRKPLQVGDGRSGDRQRDSSGQSGAHSHTTTHTKLSTRATWNADSPAVTACVCSAYGCLDVCATIAYIMHSTHYCKYCICKQLQALTSQRMVEKYACVQPFGRVDRLHLWEDKERGVQRGIKLSEQISSWF